MLNNWLYRFFMITITGHNIAGATGAAIAGGAIAAGGSIAGGMLGSGASKSAAKAQEKAAQAQIAETKREFDVNQANMAPYLGVGNQGLSLLSLLMGTGQQNVLNPSQLKSAQTLLQNIQRSNDAYNSGDMTTWANLKNSNAQGLQNILGYIPQTGAQQAQVLSALINQSQMVNANPKLAGLALQNYNVPAPKFTPFGTPAPTFTPYQAYKPMTADQMEQLDPGYQFRINQGLQAVNNSAAARGGLLSGATLKELNNYAQGQASSEFQNAFNRNLTNWQTGFNANNSNFANRLQDWNNKYSAYMNNFATQYGRWADQNNIFNQNRDAAFGKALTLSNLGQGAAQFQGQMGMNYANAQNAATAAAANARAAGTVGSANAWGNALSGLGNSAMTLGMLPYFSNNGGNSGYSLGGSSLNVQPGMNSLNNLFTMKSMFGSSYS